jgi:hypothetical protein
MRKLNLNQPKNKLSLNKLTIQNLQNEAVSQIKGGDDILVNYTKDCRSQKAGCNIALGGLPSAGNVTTCVTLQTLGVTC